MNTYLTLLSALLLPTAATAALVDINGKATALYRYDKTNTAALEAAKVSARKTAVTNAIDAMIHTLPSSCVQLYEERKPGIVPELMKMTVDGAFDESFDQSMVKVTFRGKIDDEQVRDKLQSAPAGSKAAAVRLDDSQVAVFFTARNVASTTVHEHTVRKNGSEQTGAAGTVEAQESATSDSTVTEAETDGNLAEAQARAVSRNAHEKSGSTTERSLTESGSTEWIADTQTYTLDAPSRDEFGSALTGQLLEKGFVDVIDGALFEVADAVDASFGSGQGVRGTLLRDVVKAVKAEEPGVTYIIIGTLDFGNPMMGSRSGMWEVSATVKGDVYQLGKATPRKVAALAPATVVGRGNSQLDAKKKALLEVTLPAADEILTKMTAKGNIKH